MRFRRPPPPIQWRGGEDRPKTASHFACPMMVLDFAVAKVDTPAADKRTKLGALIQTPGQMCPEAGTERADQRCDMFSHGLVTTEMMTGILSEIAILEYPRLEAWVRERNPNAPEVLAAFASRCSYRDPGKRFKSTGEATLGMSCKCVGPQFERQRIILPYSSCFERTEL